MKSNLLASEHVLLVRNKKRKSYTKIDTKLLKMNRLQITKKMVASQRPDKFGKNEFAYFNCRFLGSMRLASPTLVSQALAC